MVSFPNCKINLGLHITRKREDGYHDLETVFYPLQLTDALEIVRGTGDEVAFTQTGLPITGDPQNNLCMAAWRILKKDFAQLPAITMHLHKAIPMGAGLGGGSADGAFALKMLNQLFQLGISENQLEAYALQLGSDCPFFIRNKPCFATGRGEVMTGVNPDLTGYKFVLINPGVHVSTAAGFAGIQPKQPVHSIVDIIATPVSEWRALGLTNDFETSVARQYPVINELKSLLYDHGAVYAAMTGSGSTVYGIFPRPVQAPSALLNHPTWTVE